MHIPSTQNIHGNLLINPTTTSNRNKTHPFLSLTAIELSLKFVFMLLIPFALGNITHRNRKHIKCNPEDETSYTGYRIKQQQQINKFIFEVVCVTACSTKQISTKHILEWNGKDMVNKIFRQGWGRRRDNYVTYGTKVTNV